MKKIIGLMLLVLSVHSNAALITYPPDSSGFPPLQVGGSDNNLDTDFNRIISPSGDSISFTDGPVSGEGSYNIVNTVDHASFDVSWNFTYGEGSFSASASGVFEFTVAEKSIYEISGQYVGSTTDMADQFYNLSSLRWLNHFQYLYYERDQQSGDTSFSLPLDDFGDNPDEEVIGSRFGVLQAGTYKFEYRSFYRDRSAGGGADGLGFGEANGFNKLSLTACNSLSGGGANLGCDVVFVPEPATIGLLAFGVLLLGLRKKKTNSLLVAKRIIQNQERHDSC